jgi:hypothetical protein
MNFLWPLVPAVIGTAFLALVFRQRKTAERRPEFPEPTSNDVRTRAIEQVHVIMGTRGKTREKFAQIKSVVDQAEKEEREHAHP